MLYHPGYLGAQDTYYVGTIKGVGRIYLQTFIDTYTKVAFTKLYDRKIALVAADMLNDRVIPFYEEHGIRLLRVLTDGGTEYCRAREYHECQLYLALEDIDHSKTKARSPQTNGTCERFNRTVQDEFMPLTSGRKSTIPWKKCSKTSTPGFTNTTITERTPANIASAGRLFKLLKKPYM